MDRELERPLGQDRRPKGGRRVKPISVKAVVTAFVFLAILGTSIAISLRESPLRDPPRVAVSQPEISEDAAPTMAASTADKRTGSPSVIRVDSRNEGESGAIIIRNPSSSGQDSRFLHLPDRALIEQSEMGPLPVRGADGRRPFDVYARPWSGARGARIAIVIGGLGLSQTGTQEAIAALPPEVTLAFAPQGNSIDRWMQAARRKGHEIIIQVPLEPFDYPNVNPGRNTLTVAASKNQNLRALRWALSRTTNYTGIMNYMGGRFTADDAAMQELMEEIGERGLLYLDEGTSARSVAEMVAGKNGVPFASADAVIDQVRERGAILDVLGELERMARAKGIAVGAGSAFDMTVDAVADWANEVKKRGIELVSISAVAEDPERNGYAGGD